MAKRTVTVVHGKSTDVNGEGNEKLDGTSTSISDLQALSVNDPTDAGNPKIRGLAAGYREATRTK